MVDLEIVNVSWVGLILFTQEIIYEGLGTGEIYL